MAGGIQISQSDLLQAASSMGPSVSDSERHRYQEMYVLLWKHLRPRTDHFAFLCICLHGSEVSIVFQMLHSMQ